MKKFVSSLMALLICICLFPVAAHAASADVRLNITPMRTTSNGIVLEINVSVAGGAPGSQIENFEITYQNETIATLPAVASGGQNFIRSAELGFEYDDMPPSFYVTVYYLDFDGTPMDGQFQVNMPLLNPDISFTRTVAASASGVYRFTYTLQNTGDVALHNLNVSDDAAVIGQVGSVSYLDINETKTFEKDVTLTQNITSIPKVTYTVYGSSQTYEKTLEALPISFNNPKIKIELKADLTSIHSGESVTLTYAIINEGNVPFTGASITDPTIGTLEENISISVGSSKSWSKILTPTESTRYTFSFTGRDASGQIYTVTSTPLSIEVLPPLQTQSKLEIQVNTPITSLESPGEVTFNVLVRNSGETTLQQLSLGDGRGNVLQRFDSLVPSDRLFSIPVSVTESTTFTFVVEGLDPNGEKITAASNPIEIKVNGLLPEGESPTPSGEIQQSPGGLSPWVLMIFIFVLLLILACIVVLVMLQLRARKRRKRKNAQKNSGDAYTTDSFYTENRYTEERYTEDRYNAPANYDSPEFDEDARAEISRFASQYGPKRNLPNIPLNSPIEDLPLYAQDEDEQTVYKAPKRPSAPPSGEPRTRQDFPR